MPKRFNWSRTDVFDVNAVLGLFTYDAYGDDESIPAWPFRELDFEDSRWGVAGDTNSQAVVFPSSVTGNRHRYYLPDLSTNAALTRFFTWKPDSIHFVALKGNQSPTNYPPGTAIDDWTYFHDPGQGHLVPPTGRERARLNLWLNNAVPPANGQPIEVVISDFSFIPLQPTITAIEKIGNDLRLSFTNYSGTNYFVQSRTNLSAGNWVTLTNIVSDNGSVAQTTITNAFNQPQQFYRIQRPGP